MIYGCNNDFLFVIQQAVTQYWRLLCMNAGSCSLLNFFHCYASFPPHPRFLKANETSFDIISTAASTNITIISSRPGLLLTYLPRLHGTPRHGG